MWSATRVAACVAFAAFVGWEGLQGRYSTASHASIAGAIAAVLVLAVAAGSGRQRQRSGAWLRGAARGLRGLSTGGDPHRAQRAGALGRAQRASALGWVLLIAVTVVWDVATFVAQRRSLPTLSRLFGDVTGHEWGRALVFAGWLALGLYLSLGWRRPRLVARANRADRADRAGSSPPEERTG